ncbi:MULTISPECIES: hypothetical protein [unclassified Pseudoalteromonas]|uniref:hypothetical protein n=1 Tax=unclassified Pseudoalteromonas TaxID=194690 RepID=UPI0016040CF8|nr:MULTISPECIES: hypothetical protein [unclassified Pseudoalteromonas]MBB1311458.1 hypothetical protein [Pseudoalteromonas sp. SR41-8]MBB1408275.1 hypothetical protein [Pseudoalteromonas sp. SG44-17]
MFDGLNSAAVEEAMPYATSIFEGGMTLTGDLLGTTATSVGPSARQAGEFGAQL